MASAPEKDSLQNRPNFSHVVICLVQDINATPKNTGDIVAWHTNQSDAGIQAATEAKKDALLRFAVLEVVQVYGATTVSELLYSRRG